MDDEVKQWLHQARGLVARKDVSAAAVFYRQVVARTEHPEALLHLSFMEGREGSYRKGREYLLRAFAAGVGQAPNLIAGLIHRLRHFNESGRMRELLDASPFLRDARDPQMLVMVAAQLSWLGSQDEAIEFIDRAIRIAPQAAQLHLSRAQMNMFRGRFDDAEKEILECLRLAPDRAEAWWTLAGLRKWTAADNHVDAIRNVLRKPGLAPVEEASLQYALHREFDAIGDIPAAYAAMDAACRAKRVDTAYDKERIRHLFDRLKQLPVDGRGVEDEGGFVPVFIVGMHRSGTTLLEQLMGGDPGVLNAGELHDMAACLRHALNRAFGWMVDDAALDRAGDVDHAEVGRQYLDGVGWRLQGRTHITDKWPPNHVNVGFICQALPHAKVIHMTRDPMETCFSNLRELFLGVAPYSFDQLELADYYKQYQGLMRHWSEAFPGRILEVGYDELTRDTEATMRRVSAFCGLRFSDDMLRPNTQGKSVATASVVQVRDRVQARSTAKWVPYGKYLQPLSDGLQ